MAQTFLALTPGTQSRLVPIPKFTHVVLIAASQVSLVSSAIAGSAPTQPSQQIVALGVQQIVEPGAHAGTDEPPNITDVKKHDRTAFILVIRTQDMVVEITFREGRGAFFDVEDPAAFREMVREILDDVFDAYIEIYGPHPNAPMPGNGALQTHTLYQANTFASTAFTRERLAMIVSAFFAPQLSESV